MVGIGVHAFPLYPIAVIVVILITLAGEFQTSPLDDVGLGGHGARIGMLTYLLLPSSIGGEGSIERCLNLEGGHQRHGWTYSTTQTHLCCREISRPGPGFQSCKQLSSRVVLRNGRSLDLAGQ